MPSYAAYGLGIASEIPLPELPESDAPADIVIRLGAVAPTATPATEADDYVRLDDQTLSFRTPHGGFRITAARELTVDPSPGISPSTLRLVILGRALGALLQWRGRLVLHASAVARAGRVRVFAGASGAGKSTTAAAHLARGFSLVADDLVAIDLEGVEPRVLPAYPNIKLWPDAAGALGIEVEHLDRVHGDHEKRMLPLDEARLALGPLPIASIAILATGSAGIESLNPHDALVELLRHSYAPRIMRALGLQAEHMAQCAQVARSLPVIRTSVERGDLGQEQVDRLVDLHGHEGPGE